MLCFSCYDNAKMGSIVGQEWNETYVVPWRHFVSVQKHIFKG